MSLTEPQQQARELLRILAMRAVPADGADISEIVDSAGFDPDQQYVQAFAEVLPRGVTTTVLFEVCRITLIAALALAEAHGIEAEDAMAELIAMVDRGPGEGEDG